MAHPHGMFTWTDISLPDVQAGKEFYEQLFGWDGEDQFDPDGNLIYVMFTKDGETAAGMGPQPPEMAAAGIPPMWNSYVTVDSVDDIVAAVVEHGGSVVMEPLDVMGSGRMAIIADPTGGVVSLWQAGEHGGATKFNEHGLMAWNELMTRDVPGNKEFFTNVFGWAYQDDSMGTYDYTTILNNGQPNAGMMPMGDEFPAEIPPHWMTYFRVDDIDDTVASLKDLGGSVSVPPTDSPAGKFAVVGDPQGGTFSVIGPPPEGSQ